MNYLIISNLEKNRLLWLIFKTYVALPLELKNFFDVLSVALCRPVTNLDGLHSDLFLFVLVAVEFWVGNHLLQWCTLLALVILFLCSCSAEIYLTRDVPFEELLVLLRWYMGETFESARFNELLCWCKFPPGLGCFNVFWKYGIQEFFLLINQFQIS